MNFDGILTKLFFVKINNKKASLVTTSGLGLNVPIQCFKALNRSSAALCFQVLLFFA